ncbi:MAG: hypothetical protein EOL95_09845 [Bacteroidia bacterium]|nr:hypothetical protein [Bacteroidia bacterium]
MKKEDTYIIVGLSALVIIGIVVVMIFRITNSDKKTSTDLLKRLVTTQKTSDVGISNSPIDIGGIVSLFKDSSKTNNIDSNDE